MYTSTVTTPRFGLRLTYALCGIPLKTAVVPKRGNLYGRKIVTTYPESFGESTIKFRKGSNPISQN